MYGSRSTYMRLGPPGWSYGFKRADPEAFPATHWNDETRKSSIYTAATLHASTNTSVSIIMPNLQLQKLRIKEVKKAAQVDKIQVELGEISKPCFHNLSSFGYSGLQSPSNQDLTLALSGHPVLWGSPPDNAIKNGLQRNYRNSLLPPPGTCRLVTISSSW